MKRARHWVTVLLQVAAVASPLVGHAEPATPFVLNDNHPIIVDGQLFGGSKNSRWVARESFPKTKKGKEITPARGEPIAVEMALLQGTETLRFYDGSAFVGQGVASKVRYGLDEHGNEVYGVRAQVSGAAAAKWRVALNGSWNGLPRPFREVKPQRLWVGDLDGDGREERVRV